MGDPQFGRVRPTVHVDITATEPVKTTDPPGIHFFGRGSHANIALKARQVVTVPVPVGISELGWYEGEIIDLRCAVGLVIAPSVIVRISPLRGVVGEVINPLSSDGLVIAPSVSVRIKPLRWFEREGIRTVVNRPIFVAIRITVQIGVDASKSVAKGRPTDERTGVGLRGVVNKLPDTPNGPRGIDRRVIPIVAIAVFIGVVPLRSIVSKGVRFAHGMCKPCLVAVQAPGVGVRI